MAGTVETKAATTQIYYGSFDVSRLKGLKPTGFDLSPIWANVEQTTSRRFVEMPTFPPINTEYGTKNFYTSIIPIDNQIFVISQEALNLSAQEVSDQSGLSIPRGPLTGLFLSGCIAGVELTDQDWRDLLYRENNDRLRFRSFRVRQFFYIAGHYDQAKSRILKPLDDARSVQHFLLEVIQNMEQEVVKALEAA